MGLAGPSQARDEMWMRPPVPPALRGYVGGSTSKDPGATPRALATTAAHGVAVEHVEALAFAWLGREALAGRPGSLPAVTGARGGRLLGAVYRRG